MEAITPVAGDAARPWPPPAGPGWTLEAGGARLRLSAIRPAEPGRGELEAFVARVFRARHGARISSFMPELIGARDETGQVQAVVGLRPAASGPLFLEQYTEAPVEAALRRRLGEKVARRHIVEVGNLAVHRSGGARLLIQFLCLYLVASGYTWVVFTGTRHVLRAFRRLGLAPRPLCPADGGRLADAGDDWGSYYANDPWVMAGFIPDGFPAVSPEIFGPGNLSRLLDRVEATLVAAGCLDRRVAAPDHPPEQGPAI